MIRPLSLTATLAIVSPSLSLQTEFIVTIAEFLASMPLNDANDECSLRLHSTIIPSRLDGIEWHKEATNYACQLYRLGENAIQISVMDFCYSMGTTNKNKPKIGDVLISLAYDCIGYQNATDFEEWAGEYGYDTDSRKAEKTYNLIGAQRRELIRVLGREKYNALLACELD